MKQERLSKDFALRTLCVYSRRTDSTREPSNERTIDLLKSKTVSSARDAYAGPHCTVTGSSVALSSL
jgi:hypothetical protein